MRVKIGDEIAMRVMFKALVLAAAMYTKELHIDIPKKPVNVI